MRCSLNAYHSRCLLNLFMVLLSWQTNSALGTSLMKRIRDRQNTNDSHRGLDINGETWINVPQPVQDVLMSIDDKLRGLDTFSHTLKLARLDFSLDQLVRRMENIESKLGRLETKFDVRMEKVEEIVISKDIKEEFSNEHLSRKVETLHEKINNKAAYLDAKLDIKLERIMSKLELLERDLHNSVDDVLERLVKGEEKCSFVENEILKQDEKLDAVSARIQEITTFTKGDLKNFLNDNFGILNNQMNDVKNAVQTKENTSEQAWSDIQTSVSGTKERVLMLLQDSNNKIDNLSAAFSQGERSRSAIDLCETRKGATQEQLENLTAILEKALSIGEAKFKELDSDVEQYTKKVINGIQELWKTSDELKVDLSHTLEQGSKTREMVRREFQRLHEQIEPLPKLEPKLTDISEDLDKKVVELSTTVDNSFATLLVAQNTFIDSCKRIQQEEMHVYDILQQIVYEMRNRSLSDIHRISSELQQQSWKLNQSISQVLTAVLLTGNITSNALSDLLSILQHREQCVEINADSINWSVMDRICRQVPNYQNLENSISQKILINNHLKDLFTRNNSKLSKNSDIMYDSESEQINDSPLSLNEYEDYQLSEAYYPG